MGLTFKRAGYIIDQLFHCPLTDIIQLYINTIAWQTLLRNPNIIAQTNLKMRAKGNIDNDYNPYSIKISLQSTKLDDKYCIYKKLDLGQHSRTQMAYKTQNHSNGKSKDTTSNLCDDKSKRNNNQNRKAHHKTTIQQIEQQNKTKTNSKQKGYKSTYIALNIKDGKQYIVKFYQLSQIVSNQQRKQTRFKILQKAALFYNISSPYVIKCLDIYQSKSQGYIAVVWEYIKNMSLFDQIHRNTIHSNCFSNVLKCMYSATKAIHQAGLYVKKINLQDVYFKNGYYKICNFQIFLQDISTFQNQQNQQEISSNKYKQKCEDKIDVQLAPELRQFIKQKYLHKQIEGCSKQCDVWALGLFYLKLILQKGKIMSKNDPNYKNNQFNLQRILGCQNQCCKCQSKCEKRQFIYTYQLQKYVQLVSTFSQEQINYFLKGSLMMDQIDRINWSILQRLPLFFNQSNEKKKGLIKMNSLPNNHPEKKLGINNGQSVDRTQMQMSRTFVITNKYIEIQQKFIANQSHQYNQIRAYIDYLPSQQDQSQQQIQKQVEKEEVEIKKFVYRSLTQQDLKIYLQVKNTSQEQIFCKLEQFYFEAQKSQYMITHLVKPLEQYQIIQSSDNQRQSIQFMYLVTLRIFTNLSYVNTYLQKCIKQDYKNSNKTLYSVYQDQIEQQYRRTILPMITHYYELVKSIYKQSMELFNKYSQMLTKNQNKIRSMVQDKLALFKTKIQAKQIQDIKKKQVENKEKFLSGIQGIDFVKQEQIQFTRLHYINNIINLIQQKYQKSQKPKHSLFSMFSSNVKRTKSSPSSNTKQITQQRKQLLILLMLNYKQVFNLKDSMEMRGLLFKDYVSNFLLKKNAQQLNQISSQDSQQDQHQGSLGQEQSNDGGNYYATEQREGFNF